MDAAQEMTHQLRAAETLYEVLIHNADLPYLEWVVSQRATVHGHVRLYPTELEIRDVFERWAKTLEARRLEEVSFGDKTLLRGVSTRYGYYSTFVTIDAEIPDCITPVEYPRPRRSPPCRSSRHGVALSVNR